MTTLQTPVKHRMKLTITLDTATRTALLAEAKESGMPPEIRVAEVLTARYAHPTWPDIAEANVLAAEVDRLKQLADRLEGERDRARDSAILHSDEADTARVASAATARALAAVADTVEEHMSLSAEEIAASTEPEL